MALTSGFCLAAETLDRVVASLGNVAITASDVEQEYRVERFLDGQWPAPPPDAALLAAARERLAYQMLLIREANPEPAEKAESEKAAVERLASLRKGFAHPEDFPQALRDLGMTEGEVLARLTRQEFILRMIDQRLRPAATPSDDAVAEYYHSTLVPEFTGKNAGREAPPLSDVDSQIREVLVQKRINELLDQWIEELKPTANLRFYPF